jgi:hypothetical protein
MTGPAVAAARALPLAPAKACGAAEVWMAAAKSEPVSPPPPGVVGPAPGDRRGRDRSRAIGAEAGPHLGEEIVQVAVLVGDVVGVIARD